MIYYCIVNTSYRYVDSIELIHALVSCHISVSLPCSTDNFNNYLLHHVLYIVYNHVWFYFLHILGSYIFALSQWILHSFMFPDLIFNCFMLYDLIIRFCSFFLFRGHVCNSSCRWVSLIPVTLYFFFIDVLIYLCTLCSLGYFVDHYNLLDTLCAII